VAGHYSRAAELPSSLASEPASAPPMAEQDGDALILTVFDEVNGRRMLTNWPSASPR
jgi:hypothetical protein